MAIWPIISTKVSFCIGFVLCAYHFGLIGAISSTEGTRNSSKDVGVPVGQEISTSGEPVSPCSIISRMLLDAVAVCDRLACVCSFFDGAKVAVTCRKKKLSELPESFPYGTTRFEYSYNTVPKGRLTKSFMKPTRDRTITAIDLTGNGVDMIDADAFEGLYYLEELVLDENNIVHNGPTNLHILVPLSNTLSSLSLNDVIAPQAHSSLIWDLFISPHNAGRVINFRRLTSLYLGKNGLTSLQNDIITALMSSRDEFHLSLSYNYLDEADIRGFFFSVRNASSYPSNDEGSNLNISTTRTADRNQTIGNAPRQIAINFSFNVIPFLHSDTLDALKGIGHDRGFNFSDDNTSTDIQISVKGNPFRCECGIGPLERLLVRGDRDALISDWSQLKCAYPRRLKGIAITRVSMLHLQFCSEKEDSKDFKFTAWQLVFIISISVILSFVTLAVLYLNRVKFLRYWSVLRNWGEEQQNQTTFRWRSAQNNKYSIPHDHPGIGCKSYYYSAENVVKQNGTDDEDEQMAITSV